MYTALHLCPGTAHPTPRGPRSAPSSWALTAGGMSGESETCRLKSPSGSPAPTTRLIQTPALSIVHPPRFFPATVSMTQVPPCSLEGWYCSQIEQTHQSEIFFPFIESNFSFPSFPTVMFLLDPFGPPTVPALQTCTMEFPSMIWSMTHFWIVCILAVALGSHLLDSDIPEVLPSNYTANSLIHTHESIVSLCQGPITSLSTPLGHLSQSGIRKGQNRKDVFETQKKVRLPSWESLLNMKL